MIRIKKNIELDVKIKPYYSLTYEYMIGDADGDTTEEVLLSIDNPFIEKFVNLVESLEEVKGKWGIMLSLSWLNQAFKEGQFDREDYDFLVRTLFPYSFQGVLDPDDKINDYLDEFSEGVIAETEYGFLTLEGLTLRYFDENGQSFETEFVEE